MNSEWQNFLVQQGANIEQETVQDYGDPIAELKWAMEGDTLCDLSHEGLIRATGTDSHDFLQGQLTNDIRLLDAAHHQISGYCSPKGRLLALLRLFMRDEDYYLQLPSPLLGPTLKRLQMFVLMSKVQLENVSDQLVRFCLSGPNASTQLEKHLGAIPAGQNGALSANGITALHLDGTPHRFILHGPCAAMQTLWQALREDGVSPVGADAGRLLDIHSGLPAIYPETVEAFVPQMVNLQQVGGVSFKKGCYTGQEVVARMQYLGKLKRRMYLAHLDSTTRPPVGAHLQSPDSGSGQGTGKVVNVARAPQGGYDILAVIEIASADTGQISLDEKQLTLMPLPYNMKTSEQSPQAAG